MVPETPLPRLQLLSLGLALPIATLWWRDLIRFFRQPSRVLGALGTPLVLWLLIGSGFGGSFRASGAGADAGYLEYFFPGTVMMILLFSSIFSSISVIEDRNEGFLLSALVAPISRLSLVLGKVFGGATLALLQAVAFVLLAPLAGISLTSLPWLALFGISFLIAVTLNSLGFVFAWQLDSIQGFHAIMNLLLVPMWVLSGALFPSSGASFWIRWIMRINPLTYGMAALRQLLEGSRAGSAPLMNSFASSVLVTGLFGFLLLITACCLVSRQALKGMA
jgi:ABC-2 type transport system permease protein